MIGTGRKGAEVSYICVEPSTNDGLAECSMSRQCGTFLLGLRQVEKEGRQSRLIESKLQIIDMNLYEQDKEQTVKKNSAHPGHRSSPVTYAHCDSGDWGTLSTQLLAAVSRKTLVSSENCILRISAFLKIKS